MAEQLGSTEAAGTFDTVAEVNLYPIKSAQAATVDGEPVSRLEVGETGFEAHGVRDRDYILWDVGESVPVTQRGWDANGRARYRSDRQLAGVTADIRPDHLAVESSAGRLEIASEMPDGETLEAAVFGNRLPAVDQGDEPASYFSRLLQREVRLLRTDRRDDREVPEGFRRDGATNHVAGADGMSFLLASRRSLASLNERRGMDVPIDRYRANIVIDGNGLGPFGEDYIDPDQPFRIGDMGAWVVKACARCPIPNVDQSTGEQAGGGLAVLRGRKGAIFTGDSGVYFGQNLAHAYLADADEPVRVAVGDTVAVPRLNEHPNIRFETAEP